MTEELQSISKRGEKKTKQNFEEAEPDIAVVLE